MAKLKANHDKLAAGFSSTGVNDTITYNFAKCGNSELENSIGGCDIIHSEVDASGNLHLVIADTYDFNWSSWNDGSGKNAAGFALMSNGECMPYFETINVVIPAGKW